MRSMIFSKRLVFVYTFIVIVPLYVLLISFSGYLKNNYYEELIRNSEKSVLEQVKEIESHIDTFAQIESVVSTNTELKFFFASTETVEESEKISIIVNSAREIERFLFVLPKIYGIRIFKENEHILERWPIILNESRTDLARLKKWEFNYSADFLGNLDLSKDLSVCKTTEITLNKGHIGYLQVSMRMQDFFASLYQKKNAYESWYILENETFIDNSDISKTNGRLVDRYKKELLNSINESLNIKGKHIFRIDGTDTIFNWHRINRLGIILVHSSSTFPIKRTLQFLTFSVIFFLGLSLLIIFFIVRFTTGRLFRRVYFLIDGMRKVKEGDFNARLIVDGTDEIAESQHVFNLMVEKIRTQIDEIQREQALVAETEIKAMQSQINTHFLYNVLETIKMQAELNDQEDITKSITTLGKMMRYCLYWRNHRVTIKEELEYARSYVYLLNLRNDYSIHLDTDIEEAFLEFEIPKMVLQPIIENAFFYAIEPLGCDAVIKIFTFVDENNVSYLCVRDFGPGIARQDLENLIAALQNDEEMQTKGHIGLKNIQQRLVMFYGNAFSLKIISTEGEGLEVQIPIKRTFEDD